MNNLLRAKPKGAARSASAPAAALIPILFAWPIGAVPQELDVPYVETPAEVVDLMLAMAQVGRGDYVVDLGTGDGRIAIAAAKLGAVALGVDLDPLRVREANVNAAKSGVSEKALFLEQDLFETDLSQATVVTMFLNQTVNLKLRATLLETLRPGTRVVSHNFDMEDWQPDSQQQYLRKADGNYYMHDVYCWVIPANVRGEWQGTANTDLFRMSVTQLFQQIDVKVLMGDRPLVIDRAYVDGDRIDILGHEQKSGTRYLFNGSIDQDDIAGVVQKRTGNSGSVYGWRANRKVQQ